MKPSLDPKLPKKPKPERRDMPTDPSQLARVMFKAADKKIKEGQAAEKPSAQER